MANEIDRSSDQFWGSVATGSVIATEEELDDLVKSESDKTKKKDEKPKSKGKRSR